MNSKKLHPAFPPQILIDQFQRPVAPIPGMSMLDYFAIELLKIRYSDYKKIPEHDIQSIFNAAIEDANEFLYKLMQYQAEENISSLKLIEDDK